MPDIQFAGLDVSRETMDRLEAFEALIRKWTNRINLVSRASLPTLRCRHIIDSAQVFRYAPASFHSWTDLGSGGGLPGIVVAILGKELAPNAAFTLVESDQRKAMFLRTVSRELELSIYVQTQRIEEIESASADVVSARALMPLSELMPHLNNHLGPTGTALLHKGKRHAEELIAARADWTFDLCEYPSITDSEARILSIQRISRA